MQITNSPDINNLQVKVRFDISGATPSVYLTNLSTGAGLSNMLWAFVVKSPTGTYIHNGNITSPDITGDWANYSLTDAWPRPFNQIEWSGAAYSLYVIAKDSVGNVYQTELQSASICRPAGNTSSSKNTFGVADSDVSVKCQLARIFFQDTTSHSYKGNEGERIASTLQVAYPIDETGAIPTPFATANYNTVLVPISYSSNNYQFIQNVIYDYDLGNDTTVRIKYQTIQTFAVWCNVDLEPLVCDINKLSDSIQNGSCSDVESAQQKLNLILPKFVIASLGIMQPLIGVDVPGVIEQIKTIAGFDCNCCSSPTGIIPTTSSIIDGYNFDINSVCGDITGTVSLNGPNITFNLQDISYVVDVSNDSPSEITAFEFIPSADGCQKTYSLKVNGSQLATDILNIISNDINLINLFNAITNNGSGFSNLIVDGKCVFVTSSSYNYTFDLLSIPTDSSLAVLTSIKVGAVSYALNFSFNQSNAAALQTYLNSLGYGIFVVTNPGAGEIVIASTANANDLQAISYTVNTNNYAAALTKTFNSYTALTANQVVQYIIDYLCGITDEQVETSQDYEICYIDPIDSTKKIVTISSGAAVTDFIIELLARGCDTINYIIGLSANTCDGIKNLFPVSPQIMQGNDYILGTKNGVCARIYPVEQATRQLQLGIYDVNYMTAFCAAMALCSGGQVCAPFNYFYLTVPYSSPTDDTMSIVVNFQHPAAISYTLRYARIDNTNNPSYITIPSVLSSPYVISGLADGQYVVGITPIYSDGRICSEMAQTTPACTGINSFSAVMGGSPSGFVISYSAIASLPKIRVNISYPNGGSWSQIYTNDGVDIDVTPPASVYGDFAITISPVCNENTGFIGGATAPVILTIVDPSAPVTPTNISVTGTIYNTARGVGISLSQTIPCSVVFAIDGTYDLSGTPTPFNVNVTINAGQNSAIVANAIPSPYVIICIQPNSGVTFVYSYSCLGVIYSFVLSIDNPC